MNEFEKHYKEDLHTVELHGVTFHVKLPNSGNKRFQRAVISQFIEPNDSGEFVTRKGSLEEMADAQIDAFVKTCIRKVEGWSDYSVDKLLAMPDACEDLWQLVIELNNDREAEADDATKKSVTISDGLPSGEAKENSMPPSKSAAG